MLAEWIVIGVFVIFFLYFMFDVDILSIFETVFSAVVLGLIFVFIGMCLKIGWNLF